MGRARIVVTQRVVDLPERGERRDALDQRWCDLVDEVGAIVVPLPNRADPIPFLAAVAPSLVVLSGGNDLAALPGATDTAPERDATEAALIDHAVETGLPLLGVCRGMQMLVHHLGGALHPVTSHVGTPHAVAFEPDTGWPFPEHRVVNSFHDWGVDARAESWPEALRAVGRAADGTTEAVVHRSRPIVGIMWHPERPPFDEADRSLVRALMEVR